MNQLIHTSPTLVLHQLGCGIPHAMWRNHAYAFYLDSITNSNDNTKFSLAWTLAKTKHTEHLDQLKYHIGFIRWKQWTKADILSDKLKQSTVKCNYKNILVLFTTSPTFILPKFMFKDLLSIRIFYVTFNSY